MLLGLVLKAQDPLVFYSFEDTTAAIAVDGSSNGNDGTITGTPGWVTDGIKGNALNITDTNSVTIGNIGMFSLEGSVSLWVNCDTPNVKTNDIRCFWWAGDEHPTNGLGNGFGSQHEMHFHFEATEKNLTDPDIWAGGECSFWANGENGGTGDYAANEGDSTVHLFSDPDKGMSAGEKPVNPIIVTDETWHHVAATWGLGDAKLYLDGALIMTKNYWPGTGYALTHMFLGQMGAGNRRYIGKLDEVRIFDEVIDDVKIGEIIATDTATVGVVGKAINAFNIIATPNPASDLARINFVATESAHTTATLFDMAGAQIAVIFDKVAVKGQNSFSYDVTALPAGMYFIRMESAGQSGFTKLVVK